MNAAVTTDPTLRPYQQSLKDAVAAAWCVHRSVMLQMPTGTGKTRLFVSLIADLKRKNPAVRVLIVTHRKELVEQISHSLTEHYGLSHEVLAGGKRMETAETGIVVASVQTLARRLLKQAEGKDALRADYLIIDEAHHSPASSYQALWRHFPGAGKLGVTATPYRLKKRPFTSLYEVLLESMPMKEFITQGYLADYVLYTASDRRTSLARINRLTRFGGDGDYRREDLDSLCDVKEEIAWLYDCYERYAPGRKGIVYAVSREHAAHIARHFAERGVTAVSVDSDTPAGERADALKRFRRGELTVLVNVELFTEGFDCPDVGFVMTARPTRSLALYMQQVGRALRPTPGGGKVVILDTAGLQARFGLPDRRRDWQAHFRGESPVKEKYNQPLGTTIASSGGLLTEIPREIVYTHLEQTPYGWYIASVHQRQFLLDEHKNRLLRHLDLENIRCLDDGNYSGVFRLGGDLSLAYAFRFTPDLQLIPTETLTWAGRTVYCHAYSTLTEAFLTGEDAMDRRHIPNWGEWPFFTLANDLRDGDFWFYQDLDEIENSPQITQINTE